MTDEELLQIEIRASIATPGPWLDDSHVTVIDGLYAGYGPCADSIAGAHRDARFIAHARADIPALIAEIRRLKAEMRREAAWERLSRFGNPSSSLLAIDSFQSEDE